MKKFLALAIALLIVNSLHVQAQGNNMTLSDVDPLTTELVMELKVDIGKPEITGESDAGVRRFIPITGGSFVGKDLKGSVIPGGADWQLTRPDGVTEIKAIYAIKTDDGAVIEVDNRGVVDRSGTPYIRTSPLFNAPKGPYDWLNKRMFAGTITPSPQGDYVTIRVFLIK